jgi:hypothetical protein
VFSKTLKENKDKILFLHDHIMQLNGKVGKFTDIIEKQINWVDFGINIPGATTALIGIGDIKKSMNEKIYSQYLADDIDQHSVGMQYVNMSLAINDTSFKDEYAVWQRHINKIGNMKKAYDNGYFWAISEAKLKEISAVIAGSNELTPTIQPTKSLKNKPIDGKKAGIDYKYLVKNFKIN